VSVNVGMVYKASERDTLRLAYARGIQAPSLAELGGVLETFPQPFLPHGVVGVIGNPGMQPAVVTNYEGDWDRDLPALKAKGSIRIFYQTTDHIQALPSSSSLNIYPGPTTAAAIQFENVGDSNMVGAELQATGRLGHGFRWNANYLYAEVHDQADTGVSLIAHEIAYAQTTPKHTANLGLGWSDKRWTVDGYAQYVAGHQGFVFGAPSPTLTAVDAYATLAGRIAYKLTSKLNIAVSGQNLQSGRTVETPGLPVDRRVFVTLSANW
jgi:iron complex outermembrane receptor protein